MNFDEATCLIFARVAAECQATIRWPGCFSIRRSPASKAPEGNVSSGINGRFLAADPPVSRRFNEYGTPINGRIFRNRSIGARLRDGALTDDRCIRGMK